MIDLTDLSDRDLFHLYGRVMTTLRQRHLIRTFNNPVADYAEYITADALDLTLTTPSAHGYDAVDHNGHRYQVKGRRLTGHRATRQLGIIRD